MKAADERGRDVTVQRMIVIVWPVKICWHDRDEVIAKLSSIGLTQLDRRDLGDRVRFIGRLQRASEKHVFSHRLFCTFRIDTGGSEREQFFYTGCMRAPDNIECDSEID